MENLKNLSILFNSELQETKLSLINKKENILDKLHLEKLTLQKSLKQIEESLDFFEKDNEILIKASIIKEKDFSNIQFLSEYEKKSLSTFQKERVNLNKVSRENLEKILTDLQRSFEGNKIRNKEKNKEIEDLIFYLEKQIINYCENLGLIIDVLEENRYSFVFKFAQDDYAFELSFKENNFFLVNSMDLKVDYNKELEELNLSGRLDCFLFRIREKFINK